MKLEKIKLQANLIHELRFKIPKQILANKILQCIERIVYHNKIGFIQDIQVWFNIGKSIRVYHINIRKEKNT